MSSTTHNPADIGLGSALTEMPRKTYRSRVAVFGIGLQAYWPQFPGLRERLAGYPREVEQKIEALDIDVKSAGLVDTAPTAVAAAQKFGGADLDLIVCYVGTYATSSQVLPVVQRSKAPVLILNLQPMEALEYKTCNSGEWLANCSTCCVPEISNAFARALRGSRIGFLSQTYPGILDLYSDFTMVRAQTGSHVEVLEMCDLEASVRAASEAEWKASLRVVGELFTLEDVSPESLEWAARVAAWLDRLVEKFDRDGLTCCYCGLDDNPYERLGAGLILGNSLLTARGVPPSGEGDLKPCLAMMIMDCLEAGGSFTEFYAMDLREQFGLMGHDGPGRLAISGSKPMLRGLRLYHGKRGNGVSVEFSVKTGPVTLLAMTQTADGNLKMLTAEGESLPGPILHIGNTNSSLRFPLGPREFVNRWCEQGPSHHCALGVGQTGTVIGRFSDLTGLSLMKVC